MAVMYASSGVGVGEPPPEAKAPQTTAAAIAANAKPAASAHFERPGLRMTDRGPPLPAGGSSGRTRTDDRGKLWELVDGGIATRRLTKAATNAASSVAARKRLRKIRNKPSWLAAGVVIQLNGASTANTKYVLRHRFR